MLEAQRLSALGSLAENDGDLDRALALYEASAVVAASCGFTLWETWKRISIAEIALRLGRHDVADSAARAALEKAWASGDRRIALLSLLLLARSALEQGDIERAGGLWGAFIAENEETGVLVEAADVDEVAAPLREAEDEVFARARETGRDSSLGDAVALALAPTRGT